MTNIGYIYIIFYACAGRCTFAQKGTHMFGNMKINLPIVKNEQIAVTSSADVLEYLTEYQQDLPQLPQLNISPAPWMLINWPFLNRLDQVEVVLKDLGLQPVDYFDINGYTTAARYLYPYCSVAPEDFTTWGWYAVSRAVSSMDGELGRVLLFDPKYLNSDEYKQIFAAKHAVRKALGSIDFILSSNGCNYTTDYRASHAPDLENVARELNIVSNFRLSLES